VALHGRTEESVVRGICHIEALQKNSAAFAGDLTLIGGVENLIAQVGARFGRMDAVIDCLTGGPIGVVGVFHATDPNAYAGLLECSLVHLQRLAHAALPWLARNGGTLIAFASDAGRFAAPNQTLIGASRAGIMGFVRNFAIEVARQGIRAHCISPSFVEETASFRRTVAKSASRIEKARRRAGLGLPTPADIAPLVLFLCSDGARRITGQVISVNGGLNA
jgi:NAD(P)-dependent dehydrogenase (short-subunit alcohol dehydrogenase family)